MVINRALNRIEEEYNLNTWKYKGISLWPIFKLMIYAENSGLESRRGSSTLKAISLSLLSIPNLLKGFNKKNNYLHFGDGYLNFNEHNGETYIPQFTAYAEVFKKYNYEAVYLERFFSNPKIKDLSLGIDFITIPFYILSRIIYFIIPSKKLVHINGIAESLKKEGIKAKSLKPRVVKSMILFFILMDPIYYLILKLLKPKFVTLRCFYIRTKYPLIHVCKKLKIPTIDIQHGRQGLHHIAYSGWSTSSYSTLPDMFWCWNNADALNIKNWGGIGFNGGNLSKVIETSLDWIPKNKKVVLFTLQWGQKDYLDLKKFISEDHFVLIRRHPKMSSVDILNLKDVLSEIKRENYELTLSSQLPLGNILPYVDVHITSYSSAVLEAFEEGIPSIVLHSEGKDMFPEVYDANLLFVEKDLKKLLEQNTIKRKRVENKESLEIFFENVKKISVSS